jgi:hypothetical protein
MQTRSDIVGVDSLGHRYENAGLDWPSVMPTGRPGQDVGPVRHVALGEGPVSVSDVGDSGGVSRLD